MRVGKDVTVTLGAGKTPNRDNIMKRHTLISTTSYRFRPGSRRRPETRLGAPQPSRYVPDFHPDQRFETIGDA